MCELKCEDLPVFSSRKGAKWHSVSSSYSSHHRISPLLGSLICDYDNATGLRGASAARYYDAVAMI